MITEDQFKKICPYAKQPEKWTAAINSTLPSYKIDSVKRLAMFMAQCGHESNGFTILSENLNYSADGLLKTFPKYFPTPELAAKYAHHPEMIANRVYANRMGNGAEASGDGWKYRGAGVLQITGKNNFIQLSDYIWDDTHILIESPHLLLDPYIALHGAGWFWERAKLNPICDAENIQAVTKLINGGTHGLEDRIKRYTLAKSVLSA
jgi:putative chitinase